MAGMRYQPQGRLRIDSGNPLAGSLRVAVLPGVNRSFDPAASRAITTTGLKPVGTPSGLAAGFGPSLGSGSSDKIVTSLTGAFPATGRSYYFRARRNGIGGGGLGRLFDKTNGSTGQMIYWSNASGKLVYSIYVGGVEQVFPISGTETAAAIGADFDLLVTHFQSGAGATITAYINGSPAPALSMTYPGTLNDNTVALTIGNRNSDNARGWDGLIEVAYMADRILTGDDAFALGANRYQLLSDSSDADETGSPSGAGTDGSVVGSALAQATASATLSTAILLTGAVAAVASGAGQMNTSIPLQGGAAARASASGDLAGGAAALAGAAFAQSTASAAISTAIPLKAAATAGASAVAMLSTTIALSGAATADASAAAELAEGGATAPGGPIVDVSNISPDRIVVFDGSGSRVVVFEGSGSRVVIFEGSGSRVRFEKMSAKVPVKVGDKWTTDRDPDEISYYAADITQELLDRNTTADPSKITPVLFGVTLLEGPELQVATVAGVQRTFVVVKLGGVEAELPPDWRWVARVNCMNGERFDKTTWFNKVDP